MAVCTAWKRWVKVAQPSPYRPSSEVTILTMTKREPAGWVEDSLDVFNQNGHEVSLLSVKISGYSAHRPAFLSRVRRPCPGRRRRLA